MLQESVYIKSWLAQLWGFSAERINRFRISRYPLSVFLKNLFLEREDICLFPVLSPSSNQPSIHVYSSIPLLTRLPSTTYFCSFLLVIHLWQPTPPSHIWSLSICCSLSRTRHKAQLANFVCLPVCACSSSTHSHSAAWHLFTVVLLHSAFFVFPHCGRYQMFVLHLWMYNLLIFTSIESAEPPCALTCEYISIEGRDYLSTA